VLMELLLWNSAARRCTPVVPSMEGRTVAEHCMDLASFHPRILRRLLHFPTMCVPLRARIELLSVGRLHGMSHMTAMPRVMVTVRCGYHNITIKVKLKQSAP
jgi:hypothetical protein